MDDPAPSTYPSEWESDVVLADGGTVHLRPMKPDDRDALLGLYSRLSERSLYLRFFSPVPAPTARDLERLADLDYEHQYAIVAELGGRIIAAARYTRVDGDGDEAEVAFSVEDDQQGRGLGTVMLEHLALYAREHGIRRFVAVTLPDNAQMLQVFAHAGFEMHRSFEAGTIDVSFDLRPTTESIAAQEQRARLSEARSVQRLLAPRSIAVIGASRRRGTIGNGILRNLLDGDFNGPVYPVNPEAVAVAGVHAYPTVDAVPGPVDLAIVCVRAELVAGIAQDCVRKGVHGLVVISAGFAEIGAEHADAETSLVGLLRRNGMRMVGPNCMGVVNTAPTVRMNATFAPVVPAIGRVGFASQSGGLGIELLARSTELDLGVSTFVSLGNKADVSGNDLLQYWEEDPATDVILLYLESFGNPQQFARLARRVAKRKPIIAVKSGRTTAGARGTSSHTAALAAPDEVVDALFHQAGVIRVDTLEQLFETATVVLHQPLPRGRRVVIVSNGGGPGILAADACVAGGLEVAELSEVTQARLRSLVSPDASVRNPVDLVASATAETYAATLDVVLADPEIDAVLVIFVPPLVTRPEDVAAAVVAAADRATEKPVIACFLGRNGTLDVLVPSDPHASVSEEGRPRRRVPTFAFPEAAAASLGRAARHAQWRARPEGTVPVFPDARLDLARALVATELAAGPNGGWAAPDVANELLGHLGISTVRTVPVGDGDEAVAVADELGYPVVLKAGSPAIVHKTELGAVRTDLRDGAAVRAAFDDMETRLGHTMGGAIIQPMVQAGVETILGITRDAGFGSLVLFGLGGVHAELLLDTALRIVPVTDLDAHELVRSLRGSPLLFGYRNAPEVDVAALEELVLRLGVLAAEVPEVVELDCNPVIVTPLGATVVDVKVRIVPVPPVPPPELRRLRSV